MNKVPFWASVLLSASLLIAAADPARFAAWPSGKLQELISGLPPKINDQKYSLENLGEFGSHYVLMVYREGNGPAEIHDSETDFYVVQSGEGTVVVGGEVVNGKTTAPGEVRGDSIRGGKKVALKAGDVLNIPNGTAHQIQLEPGQKIAYMIVKIRDGQ